MAFCFGDPCVGSCYAEISPMVISARGNFPGKWGERDRQRAVAVPLRRLVLRPSSASGRRGVGRKAVF